MIKHTGDNAGFKGKRVAISGSGNVAQFAALKVIELGGIVVSLSDSKGAIIANSPEGIDANLIKTIAALKLKHQALNVLTSDSDHKDKIKFIEGARPWVHVEKADIALPSATQNEVSGEEAQALIKTGVRFVAEGSNMGCTQEAIDCFEADRKKSGSTCAWYAPGKAANAGGVAVSGLEMAQNSQRLKWTSEEVDTKLKGIMEAAFKNCLDTANEYVPHAEKEYPSLVAGANIAGFSKVAAAMHDQGDWW